MIDSTFLWREDQRRPSDKAMPSASIIVPVWNGEKMLPTCLNSVLKQDLGSSEIIIVDDGSTDGSLDVVKNTIGGRPNVRIISHSANQGLSYTLNEGIKESRGEYIQIVHQDCEILDKDYVRKAVESLETNPEIAAVTGRRIYEIDKLSDREKLFVVANGHLSEISHGDDGTQDVTFTEHKCDLFRKSTVESIGGFPDAHFRSSGEDQVLSSELRSRGYRLVRLDSISYRLGFGNKESTLGGILKKLFVYGMTQAGVLVRRRRSSIKGITNSKALTGRAMNRLQMILFSFVIATGLVFSLLSPYFFLVSAGAIALRILTYARGLHRIRGKTRMAVIGPLLDMTYSVGFAKGLVVSSMGGKL